MRTDPLAVDDAIEEVFERHPGLDTVLGHAGGCGLHPFASTSQEEFDRIFRFNYLSQTYPARAVLVQWTKRGIAGHLIFTSSYVAQVPHTRIPAYATAKAALKLAILAIRFEHLERTARCYIAGRNRIHANA